MPFSSSPLHGIKSTAITYPGMPPLREPLRPSILLTLPAFIIYLPMFVQSFFLGLYYRCFSLPTIANPSMPLGGLVNERKTEIFKTVSNSMHSHIPSYISIEDAPKTQKTFQDVLEKLRQKKINFPFFAKPDIGHAGWGIQIIHREEQLKKYFDDFPKAQPLLLQSASPYRAEFGIFFIHPPREKKGYIFSITLKYLPYIRGDGKRSLRQLILDNAYTAATAKMYFKRNEAWIDKIIEKDHFFQLCSIGAKTQGAIFKNGNQWIDPELTDAINVIASKIKNFHFGRLDIKCASLDDLKKLRSFDLIEINGAGSEATEIWDGNTSLLYAWKTLLRHNAMLFKIGHFFHKQGYMPEKLGAIISNWRAMRKKIYAYRNIYHPTG